MGQVILQFKKHNTISKTKKPFSIVSEVLTPEIHKKVSDAFSVFDHEQNNTVDVREIGNREASGSRSAQPGYRR